MSVDLLIQDISEVDAEKVSGGLLLPAVQAAREAARRAPVRSRGFGAFSIKVVRRIAESGLRDGAQRFVVWFGDSPAH
ncbi:MAG: hypothetical protein AB4050_14365 [Synechococcus sp.]